MNTVFKFYYQAWSLLSLSAAASLGWLLNRLSSPKPAWVVYSSFLGLLVAGASGFNRHPTRLATTFRSPSKNPTLAAPDR